MKQPSPDADSAAHTSGKVLVRDMGLQDYWPIFQRMRKFTDERQRAQADEIWLLQHPPVFTLGLNGKPEHVLDAGDIPLQQVDRGGQVTYHGPGQLIVYLLLELRRSGLGVRDLVTLMEESVIELLAQWDVCARARADAPGVYVQDCKIASLGLRIRRGFSYHGLALNVDMDLQPFQRINPCGYPGLEVTRLCDLAPNASLEQCKESLLQIICRRLSYTEVLRQEQLPIDSHDQRANDSPSFQRGEHV